MTQWVHFEREWILALSPFSTTIFHAVDFEQGRPPFNNLTETEKRDFLHLLVGIIGRRVEKQFSHVIPMDVYRALNAKYVFAESYGFPYPAAARFCMADVAHWAQYHSVPQEQIKYFFEDGAPHRGQLLWIADRDKLPTPIFQKKTEAVPLQAGDLISWLHTRALTGSATELHADLIGRLQGHSYDWSSLNEETGDALAKWANISIRDPQFRYKCQIIRKHGKRRAVVHYWSNISKAEPRVDRKTIVLPETLPPFLGVSNEEIAESPIMSALAEFSAKENRRDVQ